MKRSYLPKSPPGKKVQEKEMDKPNHLTYQALRGCCIDWNEGEGRRKKSEIAGNVGTVYI
ncbi:hypothetical protein J31TS3_02310 [Paenibacillus lactis]|nr:hypothetical protein J31TS3_02310 [Paenibacillus lactis]